jgi:type I restriction-modification system DNA methylase subunit
MELKLVERLFTTLRGTGRREMRNALTTASYLFLLKFLESGTPQHAADATGALSLWSRVASRAKLQAEGGLELLLQEGAHCLARTYRNPLMDGAQNALSSIPVHDLVPVLETVDALWEQHETGRKKTPAEIFEGVIVYAAREGATSPSLGQFFTPMHIARVMADLVRPTPTDRVVDLSAGAGHLLLAAYGTLQRQDAPDSAQLHVRADGLVYSSRGEMAGGSFPLIGYEIDPTMALAGWTLLRLSGLDFPEIECCDVLGSDFERRIARGEIPEADIVLANPPFGDLVNRKYLGEQLQKLDTESTEVLFFERLLTVLREGGRAAVLVPDGLLRNTTRAALSLRERLMCANQVRAIVSLPSGVFLPHTNTKTSLIIFTKGGRTCSPVWCYRVARDGFALTARRTERTSDSDLWDLRAQYALALDLPTPIWAPGLLSAEDWRCFREKHPELASSGYVVPLIEEQIDTFAKGKRARSERTANVSAVEVRERSRPTTWYASPDQIASHAYNLCADTYAPHVEPEEERIDVAQLAREIREIEQQRREADAKLAAMLSQLYPDLREAIEAAYLPRGEDGAPLGTNDH